MNGARPSDRLSYKAGISRTPISGTFELSPLCNFSCGFCYVRRDRSQVQALGGLQPMEQWLRWAEEAKAAGMLWLLLTGGEPFLYPDFLKLYEELGKMGFLLSVNSNGSLIDREAVEVLKRFPPKQINLSLYGASEETYARLCLAPEGFRRVMEATRLLEENGIPYKFNCSLGRENARDLPKIIALAKARQVPVDVATYLFPPLRRGENLPEEDFRLPAEEAGAYGAMAMGLKLPREEFLAYARRMATVVQPPKKAGSPREMSCRAGRCSFWLSWQGELSSCGMLTRPTCSLLHTSFAQGWREIVEKTNEARCLAMCGACPNLRLCHPCAAAAQCETMDFNGRPAYKCRMLLAEAAACKKMLERMEQLTPKEEAE